MVGKGWFGRRFGGGDLDSEFEAGWIFNPYYGGEGRGRVGLWVGFAALLIHNFQIKGFFVEHATFRWFSSF